MISVAFPEFSSWLQSGLQSPWHTESWNYGLLAFHVTDVEHKGFEPRIVEAFVPRI